MSQISAVGMKVRYRSGKMIGIEGTIIDERRDKAGRPMYRVDFVDGTCYWLRASNVQF